MGLVSTNYGNTSTVDIAEYTVNDNTFLATVYRTVTLAQWLTSVQVYIRRDAASANCTAKISVYSDDSNNRPQNRIGLSDEFTISSASAGWVTATFSTPVPLQVGERYGIGIILTNSGTTAYVSGSAANASWADNVYRQTGLSSGNSPTTFTGSYYTGLRSLMMNGVSWANNAPRVPSSLAPAGTINTTTPTFTSTFLDENAGFVPGVGGVDSGDALSQYHIVVRNKTTLANTWDALVTASPGEIAADATSTLYAGTALSRGTDYEWKIAHYDKLGAVSGDSAWTTITPTNVGFVTLDGAPTGNIDQNTGITFNARWNHDGGLSTNAVQIRLRGSIGGSILQTSPVIAKTVASSAAPGTNFTMSWAETAFTTLDWSKDYYYEVSGRDSANNWSAWSDPRLFTTDIAPGIPSNLTPSGGDVYTTYPVLRFAVTDGDDTPPPSGTLAGISRLVDSTGYSQDISAVYNSALGLFETTLADAQMKRNEVQTIKINSTAAPTGGTFTLTFNGSTTTTIAYNASAATVQSALAALASVGSGNVTVTGGPGPNAAFVVTFTNTRGLTDQPAITATLTGLTGGSGHTFSNTETTKGGTWFGTYSHKATGFDGTLYSGGVTTLSTATWSAATTFQYQSGPQPAITAPTTGGTYGYSSIVMTWTVANGTQAKYRVEASDPLGVKAYDSGTIIGSTLTHTVPSGWLRNGTAYTLTLTVWDSLDLAGTATTIVTISLPAVTTPTGFQAIPISLRNDPFATAIQLNWDPTTIAEKYFRHYSIWRSGGGENRRIMFVKSAAITSFVDHTPSSGVLYTYTLRQVLKEPTSNVAENEVESSAVTTTGMITLNGVVLTSVENGEDFRAVLHFADSRNLTRNIEEATFTPLAGRKSPITGARETPKPVTYRSRARWFEEAGEYQILSDRYATAQERYEDLMDLDATRHVCCYRDERGRRMFVRITDLQVDDIRPMRYTISMGLREEDYTEGAS